MSLGDYQAKRRFDATPEPSGVPNSSAADSGLKFVIQKHAASHLHYDFRLELGGVLVSWAVPKGPSLNPEDKRLAMKVEDHPFDYRTFEGIIPAGQYGGGTVMVWDEGTYTPVEPSGDRAEDEKRLRHGLHKGHITFILHGHKLRGEWALIKMHGAEENAWLLIKAGDEMASASTDVLAADRSAQTERSMDEIAAGSEPSSAGPAGGEATKLGATSKGGDAPASATGHTNNDTLADHGHRADPAIWTHPPDLSDAPAAPLPTDSPRPMLAVLADEPFDDPNWLYEIKWDGYRAIATLGPDGVRLESRRGQDFAAKYPVVATALAGLRGATAVLDGEIVALDETGRSRFQLLQEYGVRSGTLAYYVFDLLHLDGHDLTGLPLARRKEILKAWLPASSVIRYSDHVIGRGREFFEAARQQELEGVMAKDGRDAYVPGRRSRSWLKVKTHRRQEAVIGGFTAPRGSRQGFGALILGVYEGDRLVYIGHTGGGFNDRSLADLSERLGALATDTSPFDTTFEVNAPVTWVRPELVCEVVFSEWTHGGHMRQPIFVGLREDKPPHEVRRELPAVSAAAHNTAAPPDHTASIIAHDLPADKSKTAAAKPAPAKPVRQTSKRPADEPKLTHLDKVYWPDTGFTKGDLIEYYRRMAPTILPYLQGRPESLHRFPDGIKGPNFYHKDLEEAPNWTHTVMIHSDSVGHELRYLLCDDKATLLYMINLGCIELNPWNSRVGSLDQPDWAVIDLDPEDIAFDEVVRVAQTVHEVLDGAGITAYPKTSGATGLHIYIPLGAKYTHEQAKDFVHIIVQLVHARLPEVTSLERNPAKRQGRVYLDYLQNRRGQTLASPYSVRPRPGMSVATPLRWDEVRPGLDPRSFTVHNIARRLEQVGDLWAPVIGPGIDLLAALKRLG